MGRSAPAGLDEVEQLRSLKASNKTAAAGNSHGQKRVSKRLETKRASAGLIGNTRCNSPRFYGNDDEFPNDGQHGGYYDTISGISPECAAWGGGGACSLAEENCEVFHEGKSIGGLPSEARALSPLSQGWAEATGNESGHVYYYTEAR